MGTKGTQSWKWVTGSGVDSDLIHDGLVLEQLNALP